MRAVAVVVAVVSALACSYGVKATRFDPAIGPRGVSTTFVTGSREERGGELLEVQAMGLLIATEKSIVFVPYQVLQSASFKDMRLKIGSRRPPSETQLGMLRLVSRFPQGLSPPLLQLLLEAYGQPEPRLIQ